MKSGISLPIKFHWTLRGFFTAILVFSCFCSAIRIELGSVGITVTHLLMPVILLYLIGQTLLRSDKFFIYVDAISILLYTIWFISILATILHSGFPIRSITGAINLTSFVILYILSRQIMSYINPVSLVKTLLKSMFMSVYIGLASLAVALVSGATNLGATFDHVSSNNISTIVKAIPSIRSLSIEPNLFGIITATVLSIYLAIYLTWDRSNKMLIGILVLCSALILSYTRSAFIGLAISTIGMAVVSKQWKILARTFQHGILLALSIVLLIIMLPEESSFKQVISYKLGSGMFDLSSGTAIPRLVAFEESINGFRKNPIIGNGIFAANNVFVNPHTQEVTGTAGPIGWLNGLFIQALHDSGIFGLLSWLLLFFLLFYLNYKLFRKIPPSFERSILLGFIGGNMVIMIGSQASSVVWISFPYVFWAINLAFIKYYQLKSSNLKVCE